MSTDRPIADRPVEALAVKSVDEAARRVQAEAIAEAFGRPGRLIRSGVPRIR